VLARFEGDQLTLAAADNYRIAVKTIKILDASRRHGVVVPARSLMSCPAYSQRPTIRSTSFSLRAETRSSSTSKALDLVSRLIDGQFPNYQQVLPKSTDTATVDRDQLLKAVKLAGLIASSSANIVKLHIGKEAEAGITVSAAADVGDNRSEVEAQVEGDGTTIAFNAKYLLDVLQNVPASSSRSNSTGISRPCFPTGRRRAVRHVVMPVKTTS